MKKILAVVLAVVMALSVCSVMASAFDLPEFPTQEEGKFRIGCDYTYITPGETVVIPVYIVSKYTPKTDEPYNSVTVGFSVSMGPSKENADIVSVAFADEVRRIPGFTAIEANYNGPATGDVAAFIFTAGPEILNQAKLHVADITVKIADNFVINEDADVPYLYVSPYDIGYADAIDFFAPSDDYSLEGINYYYDDLEEMGIYSLFGELVAICNDGVLVESLSYENDEIEYMIGFILEEEVIPEDEKWEPVIEDAKTFGSNFLDGLNAIWNWIITINDLLKGLLAMI